nr:MAG: hypothetical protein 2 [Tombusviridae sp.]
MTSKSNKRTQKAKRAGPKAPVPRAVSGLDAAARRWIKLLQDPCGADLTSPCYAGTGAGYLCRLRTQINPDPTAVDYVFEFCPSNGASAAMAYGWSATKGGSLGNAATYSMGGLLDNGTAGRARCVAACIKVIYTGAELSRAGLVGYTLDNGSTLTAGEAIAGAATNWITAAAHTERIGQRDTEYRWVPGPGDESFRIPVLTSEEQSSGENSGNAIQVAITGMPPGTVQLHLVSIWEWQPQEEGTGNSSLVAINKGPSSRNNLNEILRALGDLGKFAANTYAPVASAGLQAAMGTSLPMVGRQLLGY